ncbi:MAG: ADP-forming succinate--CoA ligase subunit beta [Fimbriimonadaceae bacterium]
MKLHEYQSKDLLANYGVPVPAGDVTSDPEVVELIADKLGGKVVVKAQVLMGGRGKAGGVKLFSDAKSAGAFAKALIGTRLVSIQNPTGMIVERVLVAEQIDIAQEFYVSVLADRDRQCNLVMVSAEGGMEIEEVAATNPDAIVRIHIDPAWGLSGYEIRDALARANIPTAARGQMVDMIKKLAKAYVESDAEMIEINPCALTPDGKLIAADAKVAIDDNALFRHKEYALTSSDAVEDPIEAEAAKRGIAYVRLGGDIGIIGNGAGLVMCSLDEVSAAGGAAANFLDVGGGAQADRVKSCVELILMDPNVKGLMINIFGGITRGEEVAKGIAQAFASLHAKIPVVARIEGTGAAAGRAVLAGAGITPASSMQDAAAKIVALTR